MQNSRLLKISDQLTFVSSWSEITISDQNCLGKSYKYSWDFGNLSKCMWWAMVFCSVFLLLLFLLPGEVLARCSFASNYRIKQPPAVGTDVHSLATSPLTMLLPRTSGSPSARIISSQRSCSKLLSKETNGWWEGTKLIHRNTGSRHICRSCIACGRWIGTGLRKC